LGCPIVAAQARLKREARGAKVEWPLVGATKVARLALARAKVAKMQYLKSTSQGLNCIINNPILFDTCCSGIQHISALTLDKILPSYTNVYTLKDNPLN
jgi:hypothetical protein